MCFIFRPKIATCIEIGKLSGLLRPYTFGHGTTDSLLMLATKVGSVALLVIAMGGPFPPGVHCRCVFVAQVSMATGFGDGACLTASMAGFRASETSNNDKKRQTNPDPFRLYSRISTLKMTQMLMKFKKLWATARPAPAKRAYDRSSDLDLSTGKKPMSNAAEEARETSRAAIVKKRTARTFPHSSKLCISSPHISTSASTLPTVIETVHNDADPELVSEEVQ